MDPVKSMIPVQNFWITLPVSSKANLSFARIARQTHTKLNWSLTFTI